MARGFLARRTAVLAGVVAALFAVAGATSFGLVACGGSNAGNSDRRMLPNPAQTVPPVMLQITPEPGATDLPISTEIGTKTDGEITDVVLVDAAGRRVPGELREDGSAWVPEHPLTPSTEYTATVTATAEDAAVASTAVTSAKTTFTTMAEPGQRTGTGLYLFDDHVYGVAMPVVVEFLQPVPAAARAEVQRRMFVTTDPPQPGVWHWAPSGQQAFYRAQDYWQVGTTIDVRIALAGHPTGDGRYGDADRLATATIGRELTIEIDNASKEMSVYQDDELIRTMPVSLGKPSTPTSSGTTVIMSKERSTVFDTRAELGPEAGYRVNVEYAMRLTWGGEFIHAAPWSVGDQGVRNVSHGCVNLSLANASWLFEKAMVGDPVTVRGTETSLAPGNGWTAWDLSWDEFIAGSALPVPDELVTG